jgi:hypothetical protein
VKKYLFTFLFTSVFFIAVAQDHSRINNIRKLIFTESLAPRNFSEGYVTISRYYKFEVNNPLAPGALELQKAKRIKADGRNLREDMSGCEEAISEMHLVKSENSKMGWLRAGGIMGGILTYAMTIVAAESASAPMIALPILSMGGTITSFVYQKKHKRKRTEHLLNAVNSYNEWIAKKNSLN